MNKVKPVPGDVAEDKLGLSEEDKRRVINSVHIIFHNAALVKFNADLKDAINMNVEGTLRVLQLASEMVNLEVVPSSRD